MFAGLTVCCELPPSGLACRHRKRGGSNRPSPGGSRSTLCENANPPGFWVSLCPSRVLTRSMWRDMEGQFLEHHFRHAFSSSIGRTGTAAICGSSIVSGSSSAHWTGGANPGFCVVKPTRSMPRQLQMCSARFAVGLPVDRDTEKPPSMPRHSPRQPVERGRIPSRWTFSAGRSSARNGWQALRPWFNRA